MVDPYTDIFSEWLTYTGMSLKWLTYTDIFSSG